MSKLTVTWIKCLKRGFQYKYRRKKQVIWRINHGSDGNYTGKR